jgi:hypothetical protein
MIRAASKVERNRIEFSEEQMQAAYQDHVRRVGALDQSKIATLLTVYTEALDELHSWDDPSVEALIQRLESLRRLVARRARLND